MPGTENSARDVRPAQARAPRILCAGIIVLDEVFYVETLPPPDGKVEAKEFFIVNGGCAANAAVTVARLGGRAMLAGPMGSDANGDFVLAALAREKIDCAACQRVPGLATALSAIFIDARGDRTIVTHRDERVAAVIPSDPEADTLRLVTRKQLTAAMSATRLFFEIHVSKGLPVQIFHDKTGVQFLDGPRLRKVALRHSLLEHARHPFAPRNRQQAATPRGAAAVLGATLS